MTRSARERKALKILGPKASLRDVKLTIVFVERAKSAHYTLPRNKRQKLAMRRFEYSLAKLRAALKDADLVRYVRDVFPLDEAKLTEWIEYSKSVTDVRLQKLRGDSEPKRIAARLSARLLRKCGYSLTATRGGAWCKLSQVIYGDNSGDFFEVCRQMKNRI